MLNRFSYGFFSFVKSSIHSIHLVYYVEIFLLIYRLDLTSFSFAQLIFLLWNTFNDPLFGWLSDRYFRSFHRRMFCVPLFCLSSLFFWFSWSNQISICFQLIFNLCFYDTFLTFFELNFNALLTEVPINERRKFVSTGIFGHCLGKTEKFFIFQLEILSKVRRRCSFVIIFGRRRIFGHFDYS